MKLSLQPVKGTRQPENLEVIQRCMNAIRDTKTLHDAFVKIKNEMSTIVFWKCGRGGNHIWVSNYCNERLILITQE